MSWALGSWRTVRSGAAFWREISARWVICRRMIIGARCRDFSKVVWSTTPAIADVIREFARRKNCTPAQLALAWVLGHGALVIPGMKTRTHLNENLEALNLTLTRAEQKELNSQIEAITVRGDRHAPAMMKVLDG